MCRLLLHSNFWKKRGSKDAKNNRGKAPKTAISNQHSILTKSGSKAILLDSILFARIRYDCYFLLPGDRTAIPA